MHSRLHSLARLFVFGCFSVLLGLAHAQNNSLTLIDGIVSNRNAALIIGNGGTNNALVITNGGRLTTLDGTIGQLSSGRFNGGFIVGPGSSWTVNGLLTVGSSGRDNQLSVLEGAQLLSSNAAIGAMSSLSSSGASSNLVLLQGPGSTWTNTGLAVVGQGGSFNRVLIDEQATWTTDSLFIGQTGTNTSGPFSRATNNAVEVNGADTRLLVSRDLVIGRTGTGNQLRILSGGAVFSGTGTIGNAGSNSVVEISGPGSSWVVTNELRMGAASGSSNGLLVISNGATLFSRTGEIGLRTNSGGQRIVVTGAGSQWQVMSNLWLGSTSSWNQLEVRDGALLQSGSATIGNSSFVDFAIFPTPRAVGGSFNVAVIAGAGTLWTNSDTLTVGYQGSRNDLIISNGATVHSRNLLMGQVRPSNASQVFPSTSIPNPDANRVRVEGIGTRLLISGYTEVGAIGRTNRLEVFGGALATSDSAVVGNSGSFNQAIISDAGSRWDVTNTLIVGRIGGSHRLIITNGGQVRSSSGVIGDIVASPTIPNATNASFGNEAIITGANSVWSNSGAITISSARTVNNNANPTFGFTNRLTIVNGGAVFSSGLTAASALNQRGESIITVNEGGLFVTNASGTALVQLNRAHLIVTNGVAIVDRLENTHRADTLWVSDSLFVGRTGGVTNGQMRIGGAVSEWTNLGSSYLGGLVIGSESGTTGRVTFSRSSLSSAGFATTFSSTTNAVTKGLGTGAVVVGDFGNGVLNVSTGRVVADILRIGNQTGAVGYAESTGQGSTGGFFINTLLSVGSNGVTYGEGMLLITNGGTLQANQILGATASNSIFNYGGVFQFTTNAPLISGGVWGTNVRISYLAITNAPLLRPELPGVTNITLSGAVELELVRATNSVIAPLRIVPNDSSTFSSVRLASDSRLQTLGLLIESNAFVTFASGPQTIAGPVTNRGMLTGALSIVQFESPAVFEPGATLVGNNAELRFGSGLVVRSNELFVPQGVIVEPGSVTLESGSLLVAGAFQATNVAPVFPAGVIRLTNGTLSYRDVTNVSLVREGGLQNLQFDGSTTLRLNNSTNTWISHYTFTSANSPTGYAGLRLEGGAPLWQSGSLTIGAGGSFVITNATATVHIASQQLLVTNGGQMVIAASDNAFVGFSNNASGHRWTITGAGSELRVTTASFLVGSDGSSNQLILSGGATALLPRTLTIGGGSLTSNNVLEVVGAGSLLTQLENADGLYIGRNRAGGQLTIRDGGAVAAQAIVLGDPAGGIESGIRVTDPGSRLSGDRLQIATGGTGTNTGSIRVEVSNGAELLITDDVLASNTPGSQRLLVSSGGRWTNGGSIFLGQWLGGDLTTNWLVISNSGSQLTVGATLALNGSEGQRLHVVAGGRLQTASAELNGSFNNWAVVADPGSLWTNQGTIQISGVSNQLEILRGGRAFTDQLHLGIGSDSTQMNLLGIQRGYLTVANTNNSSELAATNSPGANLWISHGDLAMDALILTNGTNKLLTFLGGTLRSRRTDFDQPRAFTVGDGIQSARLLLTGNGSHRFAGGLVISPNAELNGGGTVAGSVTNSGRLSPGAEIGGLAINGNVTLLPSAGLHFDVGGLAAGTGYDQLNVSSLVEFAGTLSLSLRNGFVPGAGDAFTLMNFNLRTGTFANAPDGSRVKTKDSLGSFLVSYGPSALTLSGYQTTDSDSDQIDDAWALLNFGITPLGAGTGPTNKSGDADGDGQSNYAEFLAGTDPHLSTDFFAVLSINPTPAGHVRIRFRELSGKQYRILFSDDLLNWSEVPEPWLTFVGGGEVEWLDDGSQTGTTPAARTYKVSLR